MDNKKDDITLSVRVSRELAEEFDCIAKQLDRSKAGHIRALMKREVEYYNQKDQRDE